jgi:hypothetical protein
MRLPDAIRCDTDTGFKLGVSWDWITGLGRTFVLLIHIGPWVISAAWRG